MPGQVGRNKPVMKRSTLTIIAALSLAASATVAQASTFHRCPVYVSGAAQEEDLPHVSSVRASNVSCHDVVGPDDYLEGKGGNEYWGVVNAVDQWSLPRRFSVRVYVNGSGKKNVRGVVERWLCTATAYYTRSGTNPQNDEGDVFGHVIVCARSRQWVEVKTANEP
jgi:hypothetical protein